MEQLDFLLIFTMDVKTYSCAIWYLQFMFEDLSQVIIWERSARQPLSAQETLSK